MIKPICARLITDDGLVFFYTSVTEFKMENDTFHIKGDFWDGNELIPEQRGIYLCRGIANLDIQFVDR